MREDQKSFENINLDKMKKIVIFLTDSMKTYYSKGEIKERYYNPKNIFDEVHMISFCDKDIDPKEIVEVAGSAKLYIYAVGKINIFSLPFVLMRILRLVKKISPDVIRAYDPSARGAIAVWCGKKLGIDTVISLHANLDEQRLFGGNIKFRLRILMEKYSLSNADEVICVSEHIVPYAKRCGAKDITVIYNRVDVKRFDNDRRRDGSNVKEILSVARLESPKYQECLIRAIEDTGMNLTLIGSGEMEGCLRDLTVKLGLSDRVRFIKSVPNKDIRAYYSAADIFAIATHFEGFCIPVIEAMASGVPVVASDIPSIREITHGAGILLKNEARLFRDAFVKLRDDKGLYAGLSEAGKERVLLFDSEPLEEKEKNLYERLRVHPAKM